MRTAAVLGRGWDSFVVIIETLDVILIEKAEGCLENPDRA